MSNINVFDLPADTTQNGIALFTAGVPTCIKANLAASTDPTTSSDASQGYTVGSIWINLTLDKVFVCVDSTNGTAVWRSFIDPSLASSYGVTSGVNTYATNFVPAIPGYVNGLISFVRFASANTGPSTLNINGRGAKSIFKNGSALASGDIQASAFGVLAYNLSDDRFDLVAGGTTSTPGTSSGPTLLFIGD